MFFSRFSIDIFSMESKIETVLRSVRQPEDSAFEINAYSSWDFIGNTAPIGSAVIIDCAAARDKIPEKAFETAEYTVLLASADRLPDAGILEKADDLWIMPDSGVYDGKLLEINFKRLMNSIKIKDDNRRLEICFMTAIDSIPDLVWFKDSKGAHLIVNNSFCKAVEKTKQQIYKQGHYYIWDIPKSEYEQGDYVCLESEDDVVSARKTLLFDEKVKTKGGMRQFKTYKSPLIYPNGDIFGTCGIAHDVTDIQNTNNELDVVLESMPYAVIVADKHNNVISTNSKFSRYFPESGSIIGKDFDQWREKALAEHTIDSDGYIEITKMAGDDEKILVYRQQPIIDIFNEQIGNVNIFTDVTIERKMEQQTLRNANTDFLTGLHNRRSLFSYLGIVKSEPQISLITVDLDNFKKVNDSYGHQAGDKALAETSRMLEKCFPDDFIARLGGDEFLVVISTRCSEDELKRRTEKLLDTLCGYYKCHEEFAMMTASAGIAFEVIESGRHDIEKLMISSDSALYCAKNSGKARFRMYETDEK